MTLLLIKELQKRYGGNATRLVTGIEDHKFQNTEIYKEISSKKE